MEASMTEASKLALDGLRDFSLIKWYVIPLLAIVIYIYVKEIKEARSSGNWDAVFAGLTLFGMDFFNETWNGWIFALTGRSAFWTAPGDTALRTMIGWNIEIMFMFAIAGIIFYHSFSNNRDAKILGIPERWALAIGYSIFCVFVECLLNLGGHLVWEYPFWYRSLGGVWLIFLIGYFHFYVAVILVLRLNSNRKKIIAISCIYTVPVIMNIIGFAVMGWVY
jgi:hypothetical protein